MTPATARAMYRRAMDRNGEWCAIERLGAYDGNGNPVVVATATVKMRAASGTDDPVSQEHAVSGRAMVVLHDDLVTASFPVPPRKGDRVKTALRTAMVEDANGADRRVQGVQIAWDLVLAGP